MRSGLNVIIRAPDFRDTGAIHVPAKLWSHILRVVPEVLLFRERSVEQRKLYKI